MAALEKKVAALIRENPFLSSYMAVVHVLREEISALRLRPGTLLKESVMAEELGVSRSTVRRAMDMLVLDGLVVRRPSGTAEVAMMRQRRYMELVELRIMLDSFSSRLSAIRRTQDDLETMYRCIEMLRENEEENALARADIGFHYCIYRAAGNESILRIYDDFGLDLIRSKYMTVGGIPLIRDRIISEHMAIYHAIRQQNPQRAFETAEKHANILYDPLLVSFAFEEETGKKP